MSISNELRESVEEVLVNFLLKRYNIVLRHLEILHSDHRPFSEVFFIRAHTDRQPYDAVLKKVVHHPMNITLTKSENQAEVEYSLLSSVFPKFNEERNCSVPEPIAVFPDEEAFLMEYVSGPLLSEKIRATRYMSRAKDFAALKKWYRLCGRWLRKFQEVTVEQPAGVNIFSATMRRCEEKLDIIQHAKHPWCPVGLKELVLGNLNKELHEIGIDKVHVAGRHGDFGNWNILAQKNGITVFDFLGSQPDSVAVDILKMLVTLEDEKKSLFCSKSKISDLQKSFINGYGRLPKIQRPVAVICETLHRVCSLCASVSCSRNMSLRGKIVKQLCLIDHLAWLSASPGQNKLLWFEYFDD